MIKRLKNTTTFLKVTDGHRTDNLHTCLQLNIRFLSLPNRQTYDKIFLKSFKIIFKYTHTVKARLLRKLFYNETYTYVFQRMW